MFTMLKTRRSRELILIDFPWIVYNSPFLGVGIPCLMPRRAFMYSVAFNGHSGKSPFSKILQTFLDGPALAFEKALPAETIEKIFRKHDGLFGGTFYNTRPISSKHCVLWAFLLQTLSDGKSRSCSTAVGRIAAFCFAVGKKLPDEDTGNYCRARAKLSLNALHELAALIAKNTEMITPDHRRDDACRSCRLSEGGGRGTLRSSLERGAGHSSYQTNAEHRSLPLQKSRDGRAGILDDDARLQSRPQNDVRSGDLRRRVAKTFELHEVLRSPAGIAIVANGDRKRRDDPAEIPRRPFDPRPTRSIRTACPETPTTSLPLDENPAKKTQTIAIA